MFPQGNVVFLLQVKDNNNTFLQKLPVSAVETTTLKTITGATDDKGSIVLELNNGKEWVISIGEIKKCIYVTAEAFKVVEIQETYIYDHEKYLRQKEQDVNRSNKGFEIIEQSNASDSPFSPPNCMLIIQMKSPNGSPLYQVNVDIVNIKDSLIYRSQTNKKGEAYFILPNKNKYDIDVNELKNYAYSDFGDEYTQKFFDLTFAPTVVDEELKNDTTYQYIKKASQPSSERALIKINVSGGKRKGINETVYLRELKTGKVYSSKSNRNGVASFLVPIKHIYMIDFNYQKDADAINLMNAKEMTQFETFVIYSPDPRLEYPESFIPTPNNLLTKRFNSFLKKSFKKPKDKPFTFSFFSAKKINKDSKEALFLLTLSSSDTYGKGVRLPLNVAFVIDKSGSMYSADRSLFLKKSLWEVGNSLIHKDIVSVILFDHEAKSVQHSHKNHLERLEVVIENYEPGGGTDIFKGIQAGVNDLLRGYDPDKSNRIILLTDGYGLTPPKEITDYVATKSNEGIEFSAIGLGEDYNQSLLELIAKKGNGTFNYADNAIDLSDVFLKEVTAAFNYVVKDLKIKVFYDDNLIFSNLYGYPISNTSNDMVSFNIGKVPANTDQIGYLKFKLDNPSKEIEEKPLTVKVSYFDFVQNKKVSYEEKVYLDWTEETNTEMLLEQEEQTLYAIAILNQSLKVMAAAHEAGNTEKAKEALEDGIRQTKEIFPQVKPKEVQKLFDDVNKYIKLLIQIDKNKG